MNTIAIPAGKISQSRLKSPTRLPLAGLTASAANVYSKSSLALLPRPSKAAQTNSNQVNVVYRKRLRPRPLPMAVADAAPIDRRNSNDIGYPRREAGGSSLNTADDWGAQTWGSN